jgi:hypothetical protein
VRINTWRVCGTLTREVLEHETALLQEPISYWETVNSTNAHVALPHRWSQTGNYGYWNNAALPNTFGSQVSRGLP